MNKQSTLDYIKVLEYRMEETENQIQELMRIQGNIAYAIAMAKEELTQ